MTSARSSFKKKKNNSSNLRKFVAATAALCQAEAYHSAVTHHGTWTVVTTGRYLRVSHNVTAYYHLPSRLRHTTHCLDWEIGVAWYCVLLLFLYLIIIRRKSLTTYKTYDLYLRITLSPMAMRQRALKLEILSTKSELLTTSAQDQFAKWAKLRRSVDKGLADLEKLSEFCLLPPPLVSRLNYLFTILCRRRSCILQIRLCHEIQYVIMALDYWIAVRRWMVVQEAARVFSPSRVAWSAWMVACLTICSCRYVFLVLHDTIPSVQPGGPSYE